MRPRRGLLDGLPLLSGMFALPDDNAVLRGLLPRFRNWNSRVSAIAEIEAFAAPLWLKNPMEAFAIVAFEVKTLGQPVAPPARGAAPNDSLGSPVCGKNAFVFRPRRSRHCQFVHNPVP